RMAQNVAAGMAFLHRKGILHRDLKSLNVLVSDDWTAAVTDFGLSTLRLETESKANIRNGVGTMRWMAPELFEDAEPTAAIDVYAYGMVLWELTDGRIPFSNVNNDTVVALVSIGKQPPIPASCPAKLLELIQNCWLQQPSKRL
ncbi:kinase-like domain-containing protein, partial [Paraphysoderma sedebokerense]